MSNDHEYVLAFGSGDGASLRGAAKDMSKYTNPDDDPRGPWMSRSILGLATAAQRPNLHYNLVDPSTGASYPCPAHTGWRYSQESMQRRIAEGRILFPSKPDGRPREKVFLKELIDEFTGFSSVISDVYTAHGSAEIRDMFGELATQFPKPSKLLVELLEQGLPEGGEVLDYFAGSGTTAHAVIELNREAETRRKFVLVEMGEYFDSLLKPRVEKVMYSSEWKDGTPSPHTGSSGLVKYIRLESYEDALNNLELKRTDSRHRCSNRTTTCVSSTSSRTCSTWKAGAASRS